MEQLRLICVELQMAPLRNAVHIGMPDFAALAKGEAGFDDLPHLRKGTDLMLDDFERWARGLSAARSQAG